VTGRPIRTWLERHQRLIAVIVVAGVAWSVWVNAPAGTVVTSVPPASRPPAGNLGWVSTFNYRIVDDQGRYLLLHGFNQDSLVTWPSWQPAPLDAQDAELMQQAGFNVVRLPISWSELEPVRGSVNAAYLDRIQNTVEMLNQHDLYVILDMHFSLDWSPRFGGTGAPDWAVVPGVPDNVWEIPNASWKISPGIFAAHTYFWTSPDWQSDFEMVWGAVATRFRDDSGVIGYDLFNEPQPFPLPPHLFEERWMWPLYARIIDAIGSIDSNHLFLVEGILLWDFPTTMDRLLAPNVVWAPHVYTGALVPPAYDEFPDRLPQAIHDDAWAAQQVPAAMWVGELGIDLSKSFADAWTDRALDTFDDLRVGWAWWQWRDIPTWGIRSADGKSLNMDFLRHLARPFVVAAPPGVTGGRGDGVHGALSIEVAPVHADQPVVVSWPALTTPPPQVNGSCVQSSRWDAAQARLTLGLQSGTGCTIQVTAASA
jgi:endoglycosylceramidase